MSITDYLSAHWFIAFFWGFGALCTMQAAALLVNRLFRTIKVLVRGWPPAHLDADGDFRKVVVAKDNKGVSA